MSRFEQFCNRRVVGAAFNSSERSTAPRCLPNTRKDVRDSIIEWVAGHGVHDRPICWLRGFAGSGKSAIAQSTAEDFDRMGTLGASFFFGGSIGQTAIAGFVPTIAYQLSIYIPQMKDLMERVLELDPSIPEQTRLDQFRKLIVNPLLTLKKSISPRLIIVDALDQCNENQVKELFFLFVDGCQNKGLPLLFCLTSQTDVPDVRSQALYLPSATQWKPQETYSLVLEDFDSHGDIHIYFEEQFATILHDISDVSKPWPSHVDLDQLVASCSGLFISAAVIVQFINGGGDPPPLKLQGVLSCLDCHHHTIGFSDYQKV